MKKHAQFNWSIFSLLIICVLAVTFACQKNQKITDELEGNVFSVKFKIKDFETIVTPLKTPSGFRNLASTQKTSGSKEETLFQWNFDLSNTDPIVAFNPLAKIDYNGGKIDYSFVAGWPTTGKAISFRAAQTVLLKIPCQNIKSFSNLTLDANSSATGPRALLIDYSTNKGLSYTKLSDTIHYPVDLAFTGAAKLPVVQSLTQLAIQGKTEVWIRLSLYEGKRPLNNTYNESTGMFRIDNLLITGGEDGSVAQNKLYYHIYHAETHELVKQGAVTAQETFQLDLPMGTYYLSLLTKNSISPITFTNSAVWNNFYVSNSFTEKETEIYAVRDTFQVNQSLERTLTLNRMYSEIKVTFSDVTDLSHIDSILIQQKHPGFYYYPFGISSNSQLDHAILKIEPNFTTLNKSFYFNQFMGYQVINKPIKYELKVFDKGVVIRKFELGTDIKNNMQVLFKGLLLQGIDQTQGFTILKNETWNGKVDVDF
ncbi:hypothetical protein LZQ00_18265 [Sphingobacterium sp. SRCM116780]|uniref:hypothetical protein n=1 Tax=Sphingobacterium sp. SRCM116780 TaxID=2907623 RepID=UPI001F1CC1A8|nr:hypothetical protein [Sphingobacterium sp. SRCM116780]UIR56193.1 hypothetical protein LZQ00_18265 [Sphingobacterium sp. SRCM116780]